MTDVIRCSWGEISHIPKIYDTGYAVFARRKKPEIWFKCISDKNEIQGVGCILVLSKTSVRQSNIFVLPEFRGNGLAQKLVIELEVWARGSGYKRMDCRSVKKFYLDHGYKAIKEYKVGGWWFVKEIA